MFFDALLDYFSYCLFDDKEHTVTPSIATLKTGTVLWNLNHHLLLPLPGKGLEFPLYPHAWK